MILFVRSIIFTFWHIVYHEYKIIYLKMLYWLLETISHFINYLINFILLSQTMLDEHTSHARWAHIFNMVSLWFSPVKNIYICFDVFVQFLQSFIFTLRNDLSLEFIGNLYDGPTMLTVYAPEAISKNLACLDCNTLNDASFIQDYSC